MDMKYSNYKVYVVARRGFLFHTSKLRKRDYEYLESGYFNDETLSFKSKYASNVRKQNTFSKATVRLKKLWRLTRTLSCHLLRGSRGHFIPSRAPFNIQQRRAIRASSLWTFIKTKTYVTHSLIVNASLFFIFI